MKKEDKQKQADALHEDLLKARTVILNGFEGITVAQDTDLRRKIADAGGKYRVVKNSLIERAVKGTAAEAAAARLKGTTSLAYTETNPVALAKAITAYAKDNPLLVFRSGVVEGRVVAMADLIAVANLPSLDSLLAKVLFLINSPAQRVASSLAGVGRNLAYVIQQGVAEKKFKESAGN